MIHLTQCSPGLTSLLSFTISDIMFTAICRKEVSEMGKNQHVVPHEDGWAVQGEGNDRASSVHDTQAEAIDRARGIARNQESELLIHGRNGQIRARDSYGNDPFPPKG